MTVRTMADYPWVVVRIGRSQCRRGGQHRLARFADNYGSEIPPDALLDRMAADCPWRPAPESSGHLKRPQPLPDLPPAAMALRLSQSRRS